MTADREARILTAERAAELRSRVLAAFDADAKLVGMSPQELGDVAVLLADCAAALRSRLGEETRRAKDYGDYLREAVRKALLREGNCHDKVERLEARVRELHQALAQIGCEYDQYGEFTADAHAVLSAALSGVAPAQETDEHKGEKCQVCGRGYDSVYYLPDELWARISPKPFDGFGSGGLLCPECADRRAREAGFVLRWTAEPLDGRVSGGRTG